MTTDCLVILPVRPRPDGLIYNQTVDPSGPTTSLTFVWGCDPRGWCDRCPAEQCRPLATNGVVVCNLQVADDIPREKAPGFSLREWLASR